MEALDFYEMDSTLRGTNLNWIPRSKRLSDPREGVQKSVVITST